MKWIKYQIVCGKNENEEDILLDKKIGYSNENLAIAQKEAYNGCEIVEDEQDFNKEPISFPESVRLKGIILTEGVDYGPEFPSDAVKGRLFFKKVGS